MEELLCASYHAVWHLLSPQLLPHPDSFPVPPPNEKLRVVLGYKDTKILSSSDGLS